MADEKVYRDTRVQIGILKSRGVIIRDKKFAKRIIRETNYYNLINGYKAPFIMQSTPVEKYYPGTRFEELYALYEFDRALRIITLEETLRFEKKIKTLVAYCFSKEHGHRDYLNFNNFDTTGSDKYIQVSRLLAELYKKISLNEKDPSVSHYVNGKNYLPLWVLVNTISMGDISKFYSNMLPRERDDVAKRVKWGLRDSQLANALYLLSSFRNRCAHDELLYCYHSHVHLSGNKYLRYFKANSDNGFFAAMIAFKLVMPDKDYQRYISRVDELLDKLSTQIITISMKKIRDCMDMPSNWRKISKL
ncbi:MAG: Abi family protein [Clostridiales bacterium]|nr:Abi family protein [Clostridiales bacterium]